VEFIKRRAVAAMRRSNVVHFADSTLRDGKQSPGASLTAEQRLQVAKAIEALGVDSIEAGFPASSPEEFEGVRLVARELSGCVVAAFCRTVARDIEVAKEALADRSVFRRAAILCIGASPLHRSKNLNLTKPQVIETAVKAVLAAQPEFQIITFAAEDAARAERDFLVQLYRETIQAGAVVIGFTDTVGLLVPQEAADWVRFIQDSVPELDRAAIAVHFHNDLGMACVNTLSALKAGADIAQATLNGIGERAGNAALEEVAVALAVRGEYFGRKSGLRLGQILAACRLHSQLTGMPAGPSKAVSGPNVFRTEAGMHQDGLMKDAAIYEPFPPALVGAAGWEIVLGRHSGHRGLRYRLERIGIRPTDDQLEGFFKTFKRCTPAHKEVGDGDLAQIWEHYLHYEGGGRSDAAAGH
jgi:2-isopropylmalate synthase